MVLCELCKAIPFHNLPPFPPYHDQPWSNTIMPLRKGKPSWYYDTREKALEGWSDCCHQPSLDALKQSAEVCGLCNLILESTLQLIELLEIARQRRREPALPDFCLRLTQPVYGNDGFFVWTGTNTKTIYLLAGVSLSVDDDDKLASTIHGRAIKQDPSSEKTLNRTTKWLAYCNSTHKSCHQMSDTPLPRRVLDVNGTKDDLNIIALRELPDAHGRYFTLSHCWGSSQHFTTTRDTIDQRKTAIKISDLPKTFRDAVLITRYLGGRYLWIDSLCICQDDREDWARESSMMADVYTNSYLNIAASNAASDSEGCFTARPMRTYIPLDYVSKDGKSGQVHAFLLPIFQVKGASDYIHLDGERLNRRGWALQERCLSPRTLHFAANQMYFECHVEFRSEDGVCCYQGRRHSLRQRQQRELASGGKLTAAARAGFTIIKAGIILLRMRHFRSILAAGDLHRWFPLVETYSDCELTYITDKLPALSGLAKVFKSQLHDTYVAGLWRNSLIRGMCWQSGIIFGERISPPQPYCGPSWSWVSMNTVCRLSIRAIGGAAIAKVMDVKVQLAGDNPYGEILGAWVVVRAPVVQVELLERAPENANPHLLWLRHKEGRSQRAVFLWPDEQMDRNWLKELELLALVLVRDWEKRELLYVALLITPVIGQKNEYRRLGLMELFPHSWIGAKAKLRVVTLL